VYKHALLWWPNAPALFAVYKHGHPAVRYGSTLPLITMLQNANKEMVQRWLL
jgi:hypothetical protein